MAIYDSMRTYMQEIGEIPLISKQEEIDLAARIKGGDQDARDKLAKANLRLVVKIAHDFRGFGLPLLDLISEGNIGLMKAVGKFDPARGAKFSSYSAWWIKQGMRRAISNQSRTIRMPVEAGRKGRKVYAAITELTQRLGRPPTEEEISCHTELSTRTMRGLRLSDTHTVSLEEKIDPNERDTLGSIVPDETAKTPDFYIQSIEMRGKIRAQIHRLDARKQKIITLRYGLDGEKPQTLEEVSRVIGRTRERVRQVQNEAQEELKEFFEEDLTAQAKRQNPQSLVTPLAKRHQSQVETPSPRVEKEKTHYQIKLQNIVREAVKDKHITDLKEIYRYCCEKFREEQPIYSNPTRQEIDLACRVMLAQTRKDVKANAPAEEIETASSHRKTTQEAVQSYATELIQKKVTNLAEVYRLFRTYFTSEYPGHPMPGRNEIIDAYNAALKKIEPKKK